MNHVSISLSADVVAALKAAANEMQVSENAAAMRLLREALVDGGWLAEIEIAEDSEAEGST